MSPKEIEYTLMHHLSLIYGEEIAGCYKDVFLALIRGRQVPASSTGKPCIEEHTSLLITYADSIRSKERDPLSTLSKFLTTYIGSSISTVHLLPFYPYSSDDGFSVIDPLAVNPEVGTWAGIQELNTSYRLMFDLVANHLSKQNHWIQEYLGGNSDYTDFAIEVTGKEDISQVFRPRALPLFSILKNEQGIEKLVWTTFSEDQIDVNYHNPKVLLTFLDILLTYIEKGASLVRLDAIAFIWKELGTSCLHQPNTHHIIQFFRWVLDTFHPGSGIITETNVPHKDNISYFGNGHNEASLVYNFPLPPLVLHTFLTQNSEKLSQWASELEYPSDETTYFNFLASHDGIGLVPAKGILNEDEISHMAEHVKAQNGYVSYRTAEDGSKSAYELNCNYLSALSNAGADEPTETRARRFIASQAIMLSLRGIPGIYIHSLLGSENCYDCPDLLSQPRRINRKKLDLETLEKELSDKDSLRSQVLSLYLKLLSIQRTERVFRPTSKQQILNVHPSLFTLRRSDEKHNEEVLVVINVTDRLLTIDLSAQEPNDPSRHWKDLLSCEMTKGASVELKPYQVCWLKAV